MITEFDKALVPVVVWVLSLLLKHYGLTPDSSINDVVTTFVSVAGVFLVPNKTK